MANLLRVYNGETLIAEDESPLELIELEPETEYNLTCTWFNGSHESEKVTIPTFTTSVAPVPVVPTAMNVSHTTRAVVIGEAKSFEITFEPEDATEKDITWTVDETGLEHISIPNDNKLRFKGLKVGVFPVVITSTANPSLTQTVTFTVTN